MKGAVATADDELKVLRRALDRRRHHEDPVTGQCAVCNRTLENKRPRHTGEGGEAETGAPSGGGGWSPKYANTKPFD